jgi:hypothetical protein
MPVRPLPDRPDLDQLKRQAKELLLTWKAAPDSATPRLRDAQRAIAQQYGFESWDALRAHVENVKGQAAVGQRRRRGLDYDDPVPDVVALEGPLTRGAALRLAEQRVEGVKVGAAIPADALRHLACVPTLRRLDVSGRDDLLDADLAFLEAMPWLTAVSLARCGRITDAAAEYLRGHHALEQINLQWTATGDASVGALTNKPALHRVVLGARLTDAGAARLRDYPALASPGVADVFLSICSARTLTDDALAEIGTLSGVAALDVHMSVFGSPHYTARGVSHLRGMASLEELNFHGQLATDAVIQEMAKIPRLRHLHCQDIVSGDKGFIALASRETLEVLSARFCHNVTNRGFEAIARLPRLRSLGLGGRRLTDSALASLAGRSCLEDLGPILFGDDGFVHIARIPNLQRLVNMYNRSTTDAATRHLKGHPRLAQYSAFGTQISDESLRILAGLPALETIELESCAWITDAGLREVARHPSVRRLSVWDCVRVEGTWTDAVRPGVEAKSEQGPPGHAAGYSAETLMDYPDLAIPPGAERPLGHPPTDLRSSLVCFGVRAAFVEDGLRLSVDPGADTRWISLVSREAFSVPVRIEVAVKPITELRLLFGGLNRGLVLNDRGNLDDASPWFMKAPTQQGRAESSADARPIAPDEWARVTLEMEHRECRLFVNSVLRQTWAGDFALRSRVGIGLRHSSLTVSALSVECLSA